MGDMLDKLQELLTPFLRRDIEPPKGDFPAVDPLHQPPGEWRERDINRWLKEEFFSNPKGGGQKDWIRFIRYISVECEEQNQVRMVVMTSAFIRVYIDAELTDMWHDHRTSSVNFTLRSVTLLGVPLVPQFLSRWLTQLTLSVAGFVLNPVTLRQGALLHFSSETVRLDLHHYFRTCHHPVLSRYLRDETGAPRNGFVVFGAETYRGGIRPKIHSLSPSGQDRCHYRSRPAKETGKALSFRFADFWQISLVAALAVLTVLLLRPYMEPGMPSFSLSWSFLSSILFLLISLGIINMARWVYQFYWQTKSKSIAFRTEELRYRIDRIKRDIELDMHRFRQGTNDAEFEQDLFAAGLHRHKVTLLEEKLAVFNRELKLKFMIAYIVTIISEYAAYHYL